MINTDRVVLQMENEALRAENIQLRQEVSRLKQALIELEQQVAEQTATVRQSQEVLRILTANLPIVLFALDLTGVLTLSEGQALARLGLAPGQAVGLSAFDLYHDIPTITENIQQALGGEICHYCTDVGTLTFETWNIPRRNEQGEVSEVIGFSLDITERKHAEDELRMFKTLVEHAPDAVATAGLDGHIVYGNPAFYAQFGLAPGQAVTIPETIVLEEHDRLRSEVLPSIIQYGSWRGRLLHCRPDGTTFLVENVNFVIHDAAGQAQYIAGVLRDATAQVQHEQELQQLAAVIENSSDFIGVVDLHGQALYLNASGRYLVGLENDAAINQFVIPNFLLPEDMPYLEQHILPVVMEHGGWEGEFRLCHQISGAAIPVYANLFLVCDRTTNQPLVIATVCRDLTAQQRAEQERAALQEQIIAMQRVALRELSTPLIPIADQVVVMPLIGSIDAHRAQQILETLLEGVAQHHATAAILDITGVRVMDSQVANALIQAAQAVRLLGTQIILTGIGPTMAQTLVHLGVDLSAIITRSTLQSGIAYTLGDQLLRARKR